MIFFLGSAALLAAAGDLRMLVRGGVLGRQRIVRHLWRMCFSFFIATGSFFIGQPQVFPAFIRRTNLLFIPGILPLVLMIFWLIRVRFTKAYKSKSVPGSGNVRNGAIATVLSIECSSSNLVRLEPGSDNKPRLLSMIHVSSSSLGARASRPQ